MRSIRDFNPGNDRKGNNDERVNQLNKKNSNLENNMRVEREKVKSLQMENQTLKDRMERMNNNMKSLKYKDLMESRLNVTTENFNKEIQNLEGTLKRYMNDNKRLTMEVSRIQDRSRNFDNSMIQATVSNEKQLLKAQQKNTELMKELMECKNKIKRLTRGGLQNQGDNDPFDLDESQIPFNPNQSQMKIRGKRNFSKKPNPNDQSNLGITKFLDDEFSLSFIEELPGQDQSKQGGDNIFKNAPKNSTTLNKSSLEDYKKQKELESQINSIMGERDNLKIEVKTLTNQLQLVRSELKDKEDTTNEKNLIRKLKIEIEDYRKLSKTLQQKNLDLVKEKNSLRLKVDDLERKQLGKSNLDFSQVGNKTMGFGATDKNSQLDDLKFKVKTLEKNNLYLQREIKKYKKDAQDQSILSIRSTINNEHSILKEVRATFQIINNKSRRTRS